MHLYPDLTRLASLTLTSYPIGTMLIFCPNCLFQLPPLTAGPNRCPDCRTSPLHYAVVTKDLHSLKASARSLVDAPPQPYAPTAPSDPLPPD